MLTLYAAARYPPVGADIQFHLDIARVYLSGQNGMFAPFVMQINKMPYPPIAHLLLLPAVALGVGPDFVRWLQAFSFPVALLIAMLFAKRFGLGETHALISGLSLLGSNAFLDAVFQIRPETLDVFIWFAVTYAFLLGKKKLAIASSLLGVYNHSFASLAMNGGELLFKGKKKTILIVALGSLPMMVVSLWFLPSMLSTWVGVPVNSQARLFLSDFPMFTVAYLGSLFVGLPVMFYQVTQWKKLCFLSQLSMVTLASALVMLPVWYDRYYHYAAIPLALILGEFAVAHKKLRIVLVAVIVGFVVMNYSNLWAANFLGLWDIH